MIDYKKSVIVGYGGHAYVVAESYISMGRQLDFYTEIKECLSNPLNLEYLGFESDIYFKGWGMNLTFILGLGDNKLREDVSKFILCKSNKIDSVIDSNALISKSANIGIGVFASKGVIVNAFSQIGDFVILNTSCIIEHECVIDSAAHIAPGAVLAGNVKVGKRTFIGANSVIKEGVVIGDDVVIGAGSVIIKDVGSNVKVVGNPARIIKWNRN